MCLAQGPQRSDAGEARTQNINVTHGVANKLLVHIAYEPSFTALACNECSGQNGDI